MLVLMPARYIVSFEPHFTFIIIFAELLKHLLDNLLVALLIELTAFKASYLYTHHIFAGLSLIHDNIELEGLLRVQEYPVSLLCPKVFLKL